MREARSRDSAHEELEEGSRKRLGCMESASEESSLGRQALRDVRASLSRGQSQVRHPSMRQGLYGGSAGNALAGEKRVHISSTPREAIFHVHLYQLLARKEHLSSVHLKVDFYAESFELLNCLQGAVEGRRDLGIFFYVFFFEKK
jgi:hypothetical protein